jgi:ubiquinone/menaquinone biosynthesis C-methylase UbiE
MKIREKERGLYEVIGGAKNGELTSEDIRRFLNRNDLDLKTRERFEKWEDELKFWEEYARIYFNLEKARPYYHLSRAIESLIEPKPGDIWLDVGCGPCKMSQLIWKKSRERVKKIIGIDIVLKPARETLRKIGNTIPLELKYANIGERLPFKDDYFDGIVANLILPYVIDFEGEIGKDAFREVLKEMYRILKPGGHIVWSTPKKNVHFQWVFVASLPDMLNVYAYIVNKDITRILQGTKILRHALEIQKKGKKGVYTFLPKEELEMLLTQIGFGGFIWRKTFAGQVWVNKAFKPKIA